MNNSYKLSLILFNFFVLTSSIPAYTQVRVGYSTYTNSSRSFIVESTRKKRLTDQYTISGKNVVPLNGGKNFTRDTIWKIADEGRKFSLTVIDENTKVDLLSSNSTTETVQASRKESINTNIYGFESTKTRRALSPFSTRSLPPIVPVSTSVFNF